MHQVVPVRWWGFFRTRYAIMSHMTGFGLTMSCFILSVISPGWYMPSRIASNSRRDCSIGFVRSFESVRGPCSFPPRWFEMSSAAEGLLN